MPARIIDARMVAQEIRAELRERVSRLSRIATVVPGLAAVLVGENPASEVYVRNKAEACASIGIQSAHHATKQTDFYRGTRTSN